MIEYTMLAIVILFAIGVFAFVIWFWLMNLPPEQRYGIDECGNAKTPEYMQNKLEKEKLR